ncbi:MAG: class D beta-lactamase [Parachlamydiales bacterium]|nr:class D beta-lactamase [Parachlamydiales bacterium]
MFRRLLLSLFTVTHFAFSYTSWVLIDCDTGDILEQKGAIDDRQSPCSTFKIALSLIGFEEGILIDFENPTWEPPTDQSFTLNIHYQNHNPKLWMKNSCVWYSQKLTQLMGFKTFDDYITLLNYGNQNTFGDEGLDNGLTHCWLSSSLSISPVEQINFIQKLVNRQLPLSINAQEKTCDLLFNQELAPNWNLFGKTGSGHIGEKHLGWFVGWLKNEQNCYAFALNFARETMPCKFAGPEAKIKAIKKLKRYFAIQ